ncbi:MAG: transposase [Burkholderiales bacterium]|nr:transposase [Burkholderiales bacterium]
MSGFSPEFKAHVVALVRSRHASACEVAEHFGIGMWALRRWVRAADRAEREAPDNAVL